MSNIYGLKIENIGEQNGISSFIQIGDDLQANDSNVSGTSDYVDGFAICRDLGDTNLSYSHTDLTNIESTTHSYTEPLTQPNESVPIIVDEYQERENNKFVIIPGIKKINNQPLRGNQLTSSSSSPSSYTAQRTCTANTITITKSTRLKADNISNNYSNTIVVKNSSGTNIKITKKESSTNSSQINTTTNTIISQPKLVKCKSVARIESYSKTISQGSAKSSNNASKNSSYTLSRKHSRNNSIISPANAQTEQQKALCLQIRPIKEGNEEEEIEFIQTPIRPKMNDSNNNSANNFSNNSNSSGLSQSVNSDSKLLSTDTKYKMKSNRVHKTKMCLNKEIGENITKNEELSDSLQKITQVHSSLMCDGNDTSSINISTCVHDLEFNSLQK